MSGMAARLQRILRVRGVEHRIAQLRLAEADNRLTSLTQIGARIDTLRSKATPGSGLIDGQSLNAVGEMAMRLERARRDMAAPVKAAEIERQEREIRRGAAWAREEGTSRLHQRAANGEAQASDMRADANRPVRMKPSYFASQKAPS
jgi:hypothetical protein